MSPPQRWQWCPTIPHKVAHIICGPPRLSRDPQRREAKMLPTTFPHNRTEPTGGVARFGAPRVRRPAPPASPRALLPTTAPIFTRSWLRPQVQPSSATSSASSSSRSISSRAARSSSSPATGVSVSRGGGEGSRLASADAGSPVARVLAPAIAAPASGFGSRCRGTNARLAMTMGITAVPMTTASRSHRAIESCLNACVGADHYEAETGGASLGSDAERFAGAAPSRRLERGGQAATPRRWSSLLEVRRRRLARLGGRRSTHLGDVHVRRMRRQPASPWRA
jgi:hypothetical protein